MNVTIGFTEIPSKSGSHSVSIDSLMSLVTPKSFTKRDVKKLRRDCEIVLDRIAKHPDKITTLMKLTLSGDLGGAQAIAKELKLTEADFEKEGGGCWCLILLLVIVTIEIIKANR